eukprot:scaffold3928_cov257-Pinguiococcus_pyrenoidosus.AAC.3
MARMHAQAAQLLRSGKKKRALMVQTCATKTQKLRSAHRTPHSGMTQVLKLKKLKVKQAEQCDQQVRKPAYAKVFRTGGGGLRESSLQLLNVYQLIDTISWETEQMKVLDALKEGKDALNEIHKIVTVEAVQEVMPEILPVPSAALPGPHWISLSLSLSLLHTMQLLDESAEAIRVENEISDLLASNTGADPDLEDANFEKELQDLERELNPDAAASVTKDLPEAPETKLTDPVADPAAAAAAAAAAADVEAELPEVPQDGRVEVEEDDGRVAALAT